jgi:hypothetical protein
MTLDARTLTLGLAGAVVIALAGAGAVYLTFGWLLSGGAP